jgi:hypothetical protein
VQTIVVIPATAPSALAIESQKKFILCSLIRYGHLRAHPVGLVPKCLTRAFQQNLAVYYELSHLYSAVISSALPSVSFPTTSLYSGESTTANTDRRAALQRFVEQNQAIFEQDEHFGLVRQALDQIPRHIIQLTLPRVYCRLTVGEIGQLTQSPSVEATTELLNEMVCVQ